jgi:GTP-binding protein HflX
MSRAECEESLSELAALARASGARVVKTALQSKARVDGRTFIGKGKAAELKEHAATLGANLVLVDHDLSPAQARNLEEISELKVLDRTELILDIFAGRARTPQAKLQVEAAQLEYLLPRLTRLWEHLSRLGGGIGTRGPGESQLEVDRRRIRERLTRLRRKLAETGERLETQRKLHPGLFRVCLVGYTNTGKSSLMNAFTGAGVDARDRLFETLDATTRVLDLGPGYHATLTDTVGFIRRLPHSLVESFRATLAEASSADLLLHVIDVTSAQADAHRAAVDQVLAEIGAKDVPQIAVLNKCDGLDRETLAGLRQRHAREPDTVLTSALEGEGLVELGEAIRRHHRRGWVEQAGVLPVGEGEILARLRAVAEILEERPARDGGIRVRVRVAPQEWAKLRARYVGRAPRFFAGSG